ncbi:MAG: carboxy terminal-processing peptidase [Bacteroidia bacterium]
MTKSKTIVSFLILTGFLLFVSYKGSDSNPEKRQVLEQMILDALNTAHFQPQDVNDSLSERIYKLYMKRLDFNKKFLVQSDVAQLKQYEFQLDDELKAGKFDFFDLSIKIIKERTAQDERFYKEILSKPFDFTTNDSIQTDPDKLAYAKDTNDLKQQWYIYLKYQTMARLADLINAQKADSTKKDTVVKKSFSQLEIDARQKVLKSNADFFKRLDGITENDRLSSYISTIANTYDPHTEYFAPKEKQNFDIAMTGQLEGIGAQLQQKDGNIKVTSIVPGSASWKEGELKAGDIIEKVAQGAAEPVDVIGMELDDAVQLIRGKKGTQVKLTVKKLDGSTLVIPIIRDIVVIDETYAHSAIIDNKNKIGYIRLPIFYTDFDRNGSRTCADDVKKELIKLEKENVKGIIIDLRDNGGGSLQDVVKMAGLFISQGPIVQVKSRNREAVPLNDKDPSIIYSGPLAVMVNTNSASASEIFAAAIQDYKRGIIIGSQATFGKGTVQQIFNLDDYLSGSYDSLKPMGSVKITIEKFYRINGGATQIKGVTPDIIVPYVYQYIDEREKDQDYPLPWDKIDAATYQTWNDPAINYQKIEAESEKRIAANPTYKLMEEEANYFKQEKKKTVFSLNLKTYQQEDKANRTYMKKYDAIYSVIPQMKISSLKEDALTMKTDTSKIARQDAWFKLLQKDVDLYEATSVINDMK